MAQISICFRNQVYTSSSSSFLFEGFDTLSSNFYLPIPRDVDAALGIIGMATSIARFAARAFDLAGMTTSATYGVSRRLKNDV
jgi:hypothetical protein